LTSRAMLIDLNQQGAGSRIPSKMMRKRDDGTLRIGPTLALPAILRSLGHDPAALLAEAGFDLALFDDPDNRISHAARNRLVAHCAARTGCRHLGLLIGSQANLQSLGLVGLLVKHAPDVDTALRRLIQYLYLQVQGADVVLAVDGDRARLGYEIHQRGVEATDQIGDGAIALLFNIMKSLSGPRWKPVEVRLAHRKPDNDAPFRRFFRAPLMFDAERNELVFSAGWLDHRLTETEPELRRLLQEYMNSLDHRHKNDFPEQVRNVLRTALISGHGKEGAVAAIFSMHARTLSRRLNAFGTHFQAVADEVRFELARRMLESSVADMGRISAMLGYTDQRSFSRAFRRWSGTTPTQWRERQERRGEH
jgi:AraC-like DNA-binding protein